MRFISLASGSKGNAYLVRAGGVALLIDAGLSGREIERRIQAAGLLPTDIAMLFLTHEHADHMQAAAVLSRRFGWPVAGTEGSLFNPCGHVKPVAHGTERLEIMPVGTGYTIGPFTVRSYSISHDAADPVGYVISANGARLGIATDLGVATPDALDRLVGADAVVLESNHCPLMLQRGPYPQWLKRRIAGEHGHLSNAQAAEAARAFIHPGLRYLLLAHLSENNNTPRLAYEAMAATLAATDCPADLRVCRQGQIGNWIDLNQG